METTSEVKEEMKPMMALRNWPARPVILGTLPCRKLYVTAAPEERGLGARGERGTRREGTGRGAPNHG